jgi:hypothetical protein
MFVRLIILTAAISFNIDSVKQYEEFKNPLSNFIDSITPKKTKKNKAINSIYLGLKKGYSVYFIFGNPESDRFMKHRLEAHIKGYGYQVLSKNEYFQIHKDANEHVFREAINSGNLNQDEINAKLINYPYKICTISIAATFEAGEIKDLFWKILTEPPSTSANTRKQAPQNLFEVKDINVVTKKLIDSLIFYAK